MFSAKIYQDKIYKSIDDDRVRNRILKGEFSREECNSDEVYKFLRLLHNPLFADRYFNPITKEEWTRVVKATKKLALLQYHLRESTPSTNIP